MRRATRTTSALLALTATVACGETEPAGPALLRLVCVPDTPSCEGGVHRQCDTTGKAFTGHEDCAADGLVCHPSRGCVTYLEALDCVPGAGVCADDGVPWVCDEEGRYQAQAPCEEGRACAGEGVCVLCPPPGETRCVDGDVWECSADATQAMVREVCDDRVSRCVGGVCTSLCGQPDRKASYQGCQFWAVDLDNVRLESPPEGQVSPADAQFAIAVANVAATLEARVTVYEWVGSGERPVSFASLGPGRITLLRPGAAPEDTDTQPVVVPPGGLAVFRPAPRNVEGPSLGRQAYRVDSDLPVVAYQFNPLNNTDRAFSNDASMLVPQEALGREYLAVTGDAILGDVAEGATAPWGAFVTVVGTTEGDVTVTVEATAEVRAPEGVTVEGGGGGGEGEGEGGEGEGEGATGPTGRRVQATLSSHEVLSVTTTPDTGGAGDGNLSGTRITASGPVAVFSGNVATIVPHGRGDDRCCADHMEEQLFPTNTWGRTYVGAGALPRNGVVPEGDVWTVTAGAAGTSLAWHPRAPAGAPAVLQPWQSVTFESRGDFLLEALQAPVGLVHFVKSSQHVGAVLETLPCDPLTDRGSGACSLATGYIAACAEVRRPREDPHTRCVPVGDPAMTVVPPVVQYRDDYVFLVPLDYAVDFVTVMAPQGAAVTLDGVPIEGLSTGGFVPISPDMAGTRWGRYRVPLDDGLHRIQATQPVGVLVMGYDRDVSYGYPAGLDLQPLAP